MLIDISTEWNHKYDTHANAQPDGHLRHVVDVLAIRIVEGHLRGSTFSGIFELAEVPQPFDVFDGKHRVQVKVGWFGMKPKTSWSHITLNGDWELIRNYSGKVVHNLAA